MNDVIKWLESPEGEEWSFFTHSKLWRPWILLLDDGEPSSDGIMAFV
jgi:uncharacterized protein YegL